MYPSRDSTAAASVSHALSKSHMITHRSSVTWIGCVRPGQPRSWLRDIVGRGTGGGGRQRAGRRPRMGFCVSGLLYWASRVCLGGFVCSCWKWICGRSRASRAYALFSALAMRVLRACGALTTAICDVCHLAARHESSLGVLDDLGRGQRRRLGGRVHSDDGWVGWSELKVEHVYMARRARANIGGSRCRELRSSVHLSPSEMVVLFLTMELFFRMRPIAIA